METLARGEAMTPTPEERAAALARHHVRLASTEGKALIAQAIREAALEEREACARLMEAVQIHDPDPRAPFTARFRLARECFEKAATVIRGRPPP